MVRKLEEAKNDVEFSADKYEVLALKDCCERLIANTITLKNITSIAVFADTYSASYLKQAVTRYLSLHDKVIIGTPEWKVLKKVSYYHFLDQTDSVVVCRTVKA